MIGFAPACTRNQAADEEQRECRLTRDACSSMRLIDAAAVIADTTTTILHRSKPYCGKHALELIEAGDEIDRKRRIHDINDEVGRAVSVRIKGAKSTSSAISLRPVMFGQANNKHEDCRQRTKGGCNEQTRTAELHCVPPQETSGPAHGKQKRGRETFPIPLSHSTGSEKGVTKLRASRKGTDAKISRRDRPHHARDDVAMNGDLHMSDSHRSCNLNSRSSGTSSHSSDRVAVGRIAVAG